MGAGAENRKPIGAVVLYGVLISMVLTLVVVPAVYSLMARNTRSPRYWTRLIEKMRSTQGKLTLPDGRAAEVTAARPRLSPLESISIATSPAGCVVR